MIIEQHYGRPMDIEWGRDGADGKLYILQARPETVKANDKLDSQKRYRLKERSEIMVSRAVHRQSRGHGPGAAGDGCQRNVAACSRATCWSPT